jgi:hypothetical protein
MLVTALGESHARPAAIFWYEFDAGVFEGVSDRRHDGGDRLALVRLEMDDGAQAHLARRREFDLSHVEEAAGAAALGWGDIHGPACLRYVRKNCNST